MKKLLSTILVLVVFAQYIVSPAYAIVDPLSVPNNKVGIHILFDSELPNAASLVNSSGGDWGYVTIPIQAGDKDLVKWQAFMDKCKALHIIPIIRLASEGDYFHTADWRIPNYDDIIDFANFLNSLSWPTQNRYIIVYNEVNRADEWGGKLDPVAYAQLLDYAAREFKHVNTNFFIISAGMDNAAPNQGTEYMNEYDYYRAMAQAVPNVFSEVDGMSSHAYPNPGFTGTPSDTSDESISSFTYEQALLQQLGGKKLPVFITETGWTNDVISDYTIAGYYQQAFQSVWNDPSIIAITPFLLNAGGGPFVPFSFVKPDGSFTREYSYIKSMSKVKGQPLLESDYVLGAATQRNVPSPMVKSFQPPTKINPNYPTLSQSAKTVFAWLLKL